ncbi:MAG: efflux RND transporter permease subunit [Phycisphaerales bacterium]
MDIIKLAINKPVSVAVGVILIIMFGLIGLVSIPVQLTPTVDRPVVTVTTTWTGRSPQEVVDEITKPQEEELKNVSNLRKMVSTSSEGQSEISLEFTIGADISRALQEVSDSLRQVSDYPDEVEEPSIKAADGASENAIAWIIIDLPENKIPDHPGFDITTLYDALDKEYKPFLERIDGVAEVNIFGGREREVRVLVDSTALAQRGLNHVDIVTALRGENRNVSAGTIAEGKRDYRVRLVGEYTQTDQILDTIVAYRDGFPVFVRDIATAEITYDKQRGFVRTFGHPAIATNVIRQSGANVVDIMDEIRERLEDVRTDVLPNLGGSINGKPVGPDLRIRQVYDETTYIDSAVKLVTSNIYIGAAIAGVVLMVFLRSVRPTVIVLLALPISIIGTFLVMLSFGRTLNVISLAGLAFAVGMVVDNAIVVLENIYRRLQMGDPPARAAWIGGKEVWGAVLASTLTTAAVFIPILTIQEEAGQLFRDIALAVVAAVMLSLIVSITVIPTACAKFLSDRGPRTKFGRAFYNLFGLVPVLVLVNKSIGMAVRWMNSGWRGWSVRPLVIVVMTAASLIGAVKLVPPLDYLPAGNRNLVFGGLLIPPGLSVDEKTQIANTIEDQVRPYFKADIQSEESVASLQQIERRSYDPSVEIPPFDAVPVQNFFIGAFGTGMFVGATSQDEQVVIPVGQLLSNSMMAIPDTFGGASQSSLFGSGIGGGNTIDLEISGPQLDRVNAAANFMFFAAAQQYGFGDTRPDPANFSVKEQELQIRLNDRGRELGFTTEALGVAIRALFDGAFVGDYKLNGETVDLVVLPTGGRLANKEQLRDVPIASPAGPIVPVDSIVDFVPSLAPQSIKRIEELESVSIQIRPPEGQAIEEVMTWLNENVITPAREQGLIDRSMRVRLEGTAAKLDDVQSALFGAKPESSDTGLARFTSLLSIGLVVAGLIGGIVVLVRSRKEPVQGLYGFSGTILLALLIAGVFLLLGNNPQFLMARLVWALLVTYLLMCALFESFLLPLVIMFSVPLAVVGGFAGLKIAHDVSLADPTKAPQQLDVLTMLGFVILIGIVVNNAILLVHQALNFMRGTDGSGEQTGQAMPASDAIAESVRTRIRPIFMSVLTSVGGMLPLVLFPGAGSEMYRGLGSVVVGGLLVSTVFTLVLVPLLFGLVQDMQSSATKALTSGDQSTDKPAAGSTPSIHPAT